MRSATFNGLQWMRRMAAALSGWPIIARDAGRSAFNKLYASRGIILRQILLFGVLTLIAMFWGLAVVVMEINAFILAFSLIACVFILYDFRFGVVLLVVLMPISGSTLFPHEIFGITGVNPLNFLIFGTFLSYLLHAMFHPSGVGRFIPSRPLAAYLLIILAAGVLGAQHVDEIPGFMAIQNSYDDAGGYLRDVVVRPLFFVLFALLVAAAVRTSVKPEKFLMAMLVSIWLIGLMVVVYFLLSGVSFGALADENARGFLSPLGMHANSLARLFVIAYAILLFTWLHWHGFLVRLLLTASLVLVSFALLLTFSRAGFLGFIVVTGIFLWRRRQPVILLLGGLACAAAMLVMPGAIGYRLTEGFGEGSNAISAGRLDEIWTPLLPELLHSPLYGHGLTSILWSDAMKAQAILPVDHPHNAFLGVLLDMGALGLLVMFIFYWSALRGFWKLSVDTALSKLQRAFFEGAAVGLIAYLVLGFSGGSLTPATEQSLLWLAIGMMYGLSLAGKAEKLPSQIKIDNRQTWLSNPSKPLGL